MLIIVALCVYAAFRLLYPIKYSDIIARYAAEYGHSEALVYGLIRAESKFRQDAVSKKGASGLMQLSEGTAGEGAAEIGIEGYGFSEIFEPDINIRLGCWYLAKMVKRFGDEGTALAAYNAGPGTVADWLTNPEYSDDGVTLRHIPYSETRAYVGRVRSDAAVYSVLLKLQGK